MDFHIFSNFFVSGTYKHFMQQFNSCYTLVLISLTLAKVLLPGDSALVVVP